MEKVHAGQDTSCLKWVKGRGMGGDKEWREGNAENLKSAC